MAGPGGLDSDSMMLKAQQVWSMLDDMSESDPKAYRKFIDKQMNERKEFLSPPETHMCVQTFMVVRIIYLISFKFYFKRKY